ncbi:MAG: hypothetical protein Q7S15_02290 [bacterium]|nr:hypothetical protein [bacterium]
MSKRIVQDMVPPDKRSIRRIPVPARDEREKSVHRETTPPPPPPMPKIHKRGSRGKRSRWFLWFLALICVIVLAFSFLSLFAGAKLEVLPRQAVVAIDREFNAVKGGNKNDLSYDTIKLSKDGGEIVTATGEENAEKRATGQIVIYNNHDAFDQRLIKNTRFETPTGLIFRLESSVVVPGRKQVEGKWIPGSVEATVFADSPGDKYNIDISDFTIPGFKGDPRYNGFYARSKTKMTGGFIGKQKVVSKEVEKATREGIRIDLKERVLKEVRSQIPAGYVLYDDSAYFEFESLLSSEKDNNSIQINERALFYGIIFDRGNLSKHIAKADWPDYKDGEVDVVDIEKLGFTIKNKENIRPWEVEQITFRLKGSALLVLEFDEAALKADLLGKPKRSISAVLAGYPSIEKAEVTVTPFWKNSLPRKAKDIKIERKIGGI